MATLTLATAAAAPLPAETKMSPDVANSQQKLVDTLNANTLVTAYAHAMLNTELKPADPNSVPTWFTELNNKFATCKTFAQTWVNDIMPEMTKIPQAIINYDNRFRGQSTTLKRLAGEYDAATDPKVKQGIKDNILLILKALLSDIMAQSDTISALKASLRIYATNLTTGHATLSDGINAVRAEIDSDQASIDQFNIKLAKLNEDLAADKMKCTVSGIGLGVSIFIGVIGIALLPITFGGSVALIGISVVGIGASITGLVLSNKAIAEDVAEINATTREKSAKTLQIASLNIMQQSLTNLVKANEEASTALDSIQQTWASMSNKISAVLGDLNTATGDIGTVLFGGDLETALLAWNDLADFSNAILTSSISVEVKNMPQAA